MNLQEYISSLLKEHNCVIVPDFGGFVANYRSAVVDEFRKKIHPPSKSVLFNPHLTSNDGLLADYVSQQKLIDYSDAVELISSEVKNWNSKMNEGDRIEIGEIGFLYTKDGKIQFEQSRELNLLLAAYGLKVIDFVDFSEKIAESKAEIKLSTPLVEKNTTFPIEQEVAVIKTLIEKKEEAKRKESPQIIALNTEEFISSAEKETSVVEEIIPIKRNRLGTALKYAAAVCVVPLLFYSYWIPMETDALDTGSIQVADFNPIHTQIERTYQSRISDFKASEKIEHQDWEDLTSGINSDIYNLEFSEDFYVAVELHHEETDKTDVSLTDVESVVELNEVVSIGSYHVISGCFSVKSNAENLVNDLKAQGFSAQIIDQKGGLHRVSAGEYSSRQEAKQAVQSVESNGFSGWVLKK